MVYNFLRRLLVSRRIIGGSLLLVSLFAVGMLVLVLDHKYIANRLQQVSEIDSRADRFLLLASTRIVSSRVDFLRYYQDYLPSVSNAIENIHQASDLLKKASDLIRLPEQQKSMAVVSERLISYTELIQSVQDDTIKGNRGEVARKVFLTLKSGNDITQMIEQIVENSEKALLNTNQLIQTQTRKRLITIIVSYALILVLCLYLSGILSKSITRPVSDLRKGAEKFGIGNMDITIPMEGKDELSLLALTFNKMIKQLQGSFSALENRERELQQHRDHLEESVKERTHELLNANEQLEQEITERKQAEIEREKLIKALQDALSEVETLSGLLPICSYCKNVRDDKGYWKKIEAYIQDHSETEFSHGICPDCAEEHFPGMDIYD